jgi:hypothetical protein
MRSPLELKGFWRLDYYLTCICLFHNFIKMNIFAKCQSGQLK